MAKQLGIFEFMAKKQAEREQVDFIEYSQQNPGNEVQQHQEVESKWNLNKIYCCLTLIIVSAEHQLNSKLFRNV